MTEQVFSTHSGDIHYWTGGPGTGAPWLVFLPGLTADHRLFDKQVEEFEPDFNCVVWDAPAHGASRPFALTFSMEDMADWLHAILEREGAERPVLIGQSMGGYLSQVYMERYPGTASGFVSIDSCSLKRKYYTGAELYLLKHTEWMYLAFPWKLLVRVGVKGTATSEYGRALMKYFMESYEKREYCALADHGFRIVAEAVEAGRTYDIQCQALLICGEKDGAGSAKRYNRAWNRQDGLPLVWAPGAGHNSNTDAPGLVNGEIEKFVSSLC